MSTFKGKSLAVATIVYWFLLVYIIAALVWWFIALQQQNHQATLYKLQELKIEDPAYLQKASEITTEEGRKEAQYIGEGATFLLLILVSAVFIYRSVRRELKINRQQQNFMMAVTHELKTPIAVAKLNLETLQKHKLDEHKQEKLIQATLQETNRLSTLANNILISSQLEDDGYVLSKEELDFSLLVTSCLHDFQRRFPERKTVIAIDNDVDLTGDAFLLEILVNNLLENAEKYSPHEAPVHCTVYKDNKTVVLKVADEGTGIPEEEKKKIFERFYRIGNEKVRHTKGTGLGLYLCKKIAHDHKADISVTNNNPTGSIFAVYFTV
jgi:two-component system sensor histidine kinase CiaH